MIPETEAPPRSPVAASVPRTFKDGAVLALPWLTLVFVLGLAALDRSGTRAASSGPSMDPVCGMEVREGPHRSSLGGSPVFFCSRMCKEEFDADPGGFAEAPREPGSHLMRGLPAWMYQAAVALILILSFGLFERKTDGPSSPALSARWDLTVLPGVRRALKWKYFPFALRVPFAAAFILIVAAGLFGDQNPARNIAPLLTWTVWWAGLIFLILFLGKSWCTVCPWDALASWAERLKAAGPRGAGLGLDLRWPRPLRNIWPAVGLFLALTWIELGMGVTLIPRATAWIALGMAAMAFVSAFLFERKAFCRYACLVGRVSGLYALFSSLEVRAADPKECASCRTMDCFRGNERGDGCPTFEFPRTMTVSTYCTMCTECFRTCPRDNVALRLRPWGADLAAEGRPRTDEAILALVLLSMTGFHGLTMTPKWPAANAALQGAWGVPYAVSFTILMALMLALPIVLYAGLVGVSVRAVPEAGFKTAFVEYAYSLLPIALFYHLAHNAEHFLMEGPKLAALASDPFGWGWNLFGTAAWRLGPLVTMEGLWRLQILFVVIGHAFGLWIAARTTRRLIPEGKRSLAGKLPMLAAMILFSVFSLWLLRQPMEMRVSGM